MKLRYGGEGGNFPGNGYVYYTNCFADSMNTSFYQDIIFRCVLNMYPWMHLKYTLKRLKNETKQNIRIFLAHSFTSRLKHQVWTRRNQKSLAAKGKIM